MKYKTANLYKYISSTESEGPGKRFTIWFQGCLKRCKGCCNLNMLRLENKNIIYIEELKEKIIDSKIKNNIEGITFLGGEPILQIYALIDLVKFCKEQGLSSMVFSGYKKEEIERMLPEESKELFENLDILIDGEFEIDNIDNERKWIGSKNQKIHFFTDRYTMNDFLSDYKKSIEIRSDNKELIINGYPFKEKN